MARARVEPIFLSAVAPSYEEMKLPCTQVRHLLPSFFLFLLRFAFAIPAPPSSDTPPMLFRFYHVRATDRMFTFPRPKTRVRFHLVTPVFPRRHPSRRNPIKSDGS